MGYSKSWKRRVYKKHTGGSTAAGSFERTFRNRKGAATQGGNLADRRLAHRGAPIKAGKAGKG